MQKDSTTPPKLKLKITTIFYQHRDDPKDPFLQLLVKLAIIIYIGSGIPLVPLPVGSGIQRTGAITYCM